LIRDLFNIGSNKFVKNTVTLVSGNFLAQIIPFLLAPIITRLYSPEQFGTFGIIVSIVTILVVIINGRYEMAIMLPKMERKAVELCHMGYMINGASSIFIGLIIFIFYDFFTSTFRLNEEDGVLLFTIPLFTLVMGSYNNLNYWLLRIKKFELLSVGKIIQFLCIVLFTILFGYLGNIHGLIYGYLIAWAIYSALTHYQSIKPGFFSYRVHFERIFNTAKEYKDFPLFNSISALLIVLGQTISTFYIQKHFSAEDTGFFSQCRQYVLAPLSLIVIAISQSFMQDVGLKIRQKVSVLSFVKKLFMVSIGIGIVMVVMVLWLAPDLFRIFFGEQWETSGIFLQILIFSYVVQSIVIPFGSIIHLLNKTRHTLIFPIIYFLSLILYFIFAPPIYVLF
jgi:O-antigen/teichoic acid export membrane protein